MWSFFSLPNSRYNQLQKLQLQRSNKHLEINLSKENGQDFFYCNWTIFVTVQEFWVWAPRVASLRSPDLLYKSNFQHIAIWRVHFKEIILSKNFASTQAITNANKAIHQNFVVHWLWEIHLHKHIEGPITVERLKCCDWSHYEHTEVNFSKLTHNNKIFRNDFVCIHYYFCKISSQNKECKSFWVHMNYF